MHIHTIDLHFQGMPGVIASFLLESEGQWALIETGPGSCHDALIAGLRAAGADPSQVRHVFVTHIHLDHAGGAGWWAQQGATVFCHPQAERHLLDPSKLIASARLIYEDRMDTLWGDILPAPAAQVRALQDGEKVRLGAVEITAWDTPGHARHHHAYSVGDVCFTGDVAGVRLEKSAYLSVAAAPPQFDPVAYVKSVDRLAAANFHRLYLTHFGEVGDPSEHLRLYRRRILDVHEFIKAQLATGADENQIRERYAASEHKNATDLSVSEALWQTYQNSNATAMCADGIRLACLKV
jgi:glyoxylase-like metal-dependent hydrolase (beta-lactamase superfamily II)